MSWPLVKLSKVCEINIGKTPARANAAYWGNGFPWLSIADMNQGRELYKTKEQITEQALKETKIKIVSKGTVLFSFKLSIGKIGIAQRDLYTNEAIAAFPIKDSGVLCEEYLVYALSKMDAFKTTDRAVMGATLNKKKLAELQIPLPPLEEQKRIAVILDKADALRRKREKSIALTDDLLRSVFLDMFGDPVTNPKGWKIGRIGDLLSHVNYGTSSKAGEKGKYPILRMGNITYEGGWKLSDLKYIDLDKREYSKYIAEDGDILFNRTNSKELVGKTAVFREKEPYAFAGYLVRAKTNDLAEPEYISAYLNSDYGKTVLKNMCKSIVGMANINAKEFQAINIPIPPIEAQKRFSEIIRSRDKNILSLNDSLKVCETLFRSLAQRAFRGELTSQEEVV